MTPSEALRSAIQQIGGVAATARLFGINSQAVSQWQQCPVNRVLAIEDAAQGSVTRHDLRPDIYGPAKTEAA